jgi:hypothetical protein
MHWNNSIDQIGEHGFEPLIGHRLFDAFDGARRGGSQAPTKL